MGTTKNKPPAWPCGFPDSDGHILYYCKEEQREYLWPFSVEVAGDIEHWRNERYEERNKGKSGAV